MRLSNGEVRLEDLPADPTRWSGLCRLWNKKESETNVEQNARKPLTFWERSVIITNIA